MMAADIEIFDSAGRLSFRATDYLARVLGTLYTNAQDGDYDSPYPFVGTAWATCLPPAETTGLAPSVSVTGSRVSWRYGAGARQPVYITYGCY